MLQLVSHMTSCDTLTLSISISQDIYTIHLFIYLSTFVSICVSISLSVYLSMCWFVFLSVWLPVYLCIYLIFIYPRGESGDYYRVNHNTTNIGCCYYWCGRRFTSNCGSHYNDYFVSYVKHNQR